MGDEKSETNTESGLFKKKKKASGGDNWSKKQLRNDETQKRRLELKIQQKMKTNKVSQSCRAINSLQLATILLHRSFHLSKRSISGHYRGLIGQ